MAEKKKSVTVYLPGEVFEGLDLLCQALTAEGKPVYKRAALVREFIENALETGYVPKRNRGEPLESADPVASNDPPKIPAAAHPAEPKTEGIPESLAAVLE